MIKADFGVMDSIRKTVAPLSRISRPAKADLQFRVVCQDCRNPTPNLVEDFASGDVICRDCGTIVLDRIIDTRSEWRSFANDGTSASDDPSRVGGPQDPLLYGGGGLGGDEDGGDFAIESTLISKMDGGSGISRDLARTQNKTSLRPSDRTLIQAFKNISIISERINLPKRIVDRAKHIFKRVEDGKFLKGKPVDGIIAACIYIACRLERVTRTFKEISLLTMIPKKDIGRCYKALYPLLFPHAPSDSSISSAGRVSALSSSSSSSSSGSSSTSSSQGGTPPMSPGYSSSMIATTTEDGRPLMGGGSTYIQDFMARFCSNLSLPMEVQKGATVLCQRALEMECVSGKSPVSIAATGIYMMTLLFPQHRRPTRDISFISGVSEITIRNTFKELYPYRQSLVTQDMAPKILVESMPAS